MSHPVPTRTYMEDAEYIYRRDFGIFLKNKDVENMKRILSLLVQDGFYEAEKELREKFNEVK